ncbi:MAG: MTH938/NDUFAF3 family protein [Gemmatimonadota bacterium]|nr:MTH938/NDUFAF3 family protein [Gemmatimonadota bacterium]
MRPHLDRTEFGWIEIDGQRYEHDVFVRRDGTVEKRKKKLSKRVYGTSHTISLDEAKHVHEKGTSTLILGSGQHGCVHLSEEAAEYFKQHDVNVRLLPTPDAIAAWNDAPMKSIGLFHVTC